MPISKITLACAVLVCALPSFSQQPRATSNHQRRGRLSNDYFLLIEATTYRIGTQQYAEATVSVREASHPTTKAGMEVSSCQITDPVKGEKVPGRRTVETKCKADWKIDSDSDDAMKDFTVEGTASSESYGHLSATEVFKYKEMSGALKARGKATK